MPTEFTNDEFKQVLDHNKITHGKAERMQSKRDGRILQMFQIELSDPAKAEQAKLHTHKLGSFSRWKSLVLPFRSSSVITAKISDIRPKTVRLKLSVLSVEKATLTKDAQTEKHSNPNVLTVKDHMLQTIKDVQLIKNRWRTKKAMPSF